MSQRGYLYRRISGNVVQACPETVIRQDDAIGILLLTGIMIPAEFDQPINRI